MDIDGALAAQRVDAPGVYQKQDGQLSMGNKVVRLDVNGKTLIVDDTEYKLTPGLVVLIILVINTNTNTTLTASTVTSYQLSVINTTSIIMIVYKSRRFAMRRYTYGGPGIADMIGSLLARYATKARLTTAAKTTMQGTLDAAKRAVPHLIAHKVASNIAAATAKKRKRVDIGVKHSQEPQLKTAFLDTGGIYINALIDGSGIVLD